MKSPFSIPVTPDWEAFLRCIRREETPKRVHHIELFLDGEVEIALCERFGILDGLDERDPFFPEKRRIAIARFLGYDYIRVGLEGMEMSLHWVSTDDTAALERKGGRGYVDEHKGPVTTWEEFEKYPWPNPHTAGTRSLDWFEENLPEDMCIIGSGGFAHFAEYICWLMGYETLCYALFDKRDLVKAIADRLVEMYETAARRLASYSRIKILWGSDDMGFRSGPLISPADLREFVLPGHKRMAEIAHRAGMPYLLHSCGNLSSIMEDLIEDVKIDARHSFEDTIESVTDAKAQVGNRIALLGGIDVDFLCRADEDQVRQRVRKTLEVCQPGGGYCLGTGNSVTNYVPIRNYLAMLDEGRKFGKV